MRPKLQGVSLARGEIQLGPLRVSCRLGDVSTARVDGIVNSGNDEMWMQSGVAAALRMRGGSEIEEEARRAGKRALGDCIATTGGALACKKVLHAVGAWKEVSCIGRATQRALLLAEELGLRSLAFPALGTGKAGVTRAASAYAMASALYWHILLGGSGLRDVEFVLHEKDSLEIFIEELSSVFLGDVEQVDDAPVSLRDVALDPTVEISSLTRPIPE
jgi:serine/threonine-protein kinase